MAKKEKNQEQSLATASSQKKISFFSAILIVMGSSIGAGIFFKSGAVLSNSQSSLVLAIFCWIIAAISVVAMALALVEVSSARNDNLSMIGWAKVFNGRTTFKACRNFMFYIYLPLTYFFMPLYVIMSLQDGIGLLSQKDPSFGTSADWVIWTIISLAMSAYFIFVSGISSKAGNIHNKIITYIKFIPLAMVAVIGFIICGQGYGGAVNAETVKPDYALPGNTIAGGASFIKFAPGLGMFMAISAIFFAYDGFYVAAGIQSDMKEPKKTPMALLFGLLANTVIYLIIAISMSISGGTLSTLGNNMNTAWGDAGRIIAGIINIMVAIGVIGIINGFAMWAPRFTEDLIKEGELPFSIKYKDKLNENKPMVGIWYSVAITLPVVIVFTIIGAVAYIDDQGYGDYYGAGMGKLYSFADLMGTWTAAFTFGFITASIAGCLKNRKTQRVQTDQKKYFVPMAYVSILMITLSLGVLILQPIIDLMLMPQVNKDLIDLWNGLNPDDTIASYTDLMVSRIMLVVALLLFVGLSYGPTIIEDRLNIKKHGSIENYEKWQKANFIVS